MVTSPLLFPDSFRWGTATSSYQVEGSITNNDWFAAAQTGGYIYENQAAGLACDWWNSAEADFDRMVELNQNAHRLSIEWSRIEPRQGVWDDDALARYRDMLIGLRQRGIEPMVTLHHFTNPIWLTEQGGWDNEAVVGLFERYTQKVVSVLGDLTPLWCTINEPAVMISHAYGLGRFPPGIRDFNAWIRVAVNVVRSHAAAYHAIHRLLPDAHVGIAKHMVYWKPWRPVLPNDQIASWFLAYLFNNLLLTMMTRGIMRIPGRRSLLLPETANTLDWIGLNYYTRYRIQFELFSTELKPRYKPGAMKGPGEWGEIHPHGMQIIMKQLWQRYRLPLYITENGIPDHTDEHRPQFIIDHLSQVWEAIQQNIPILGYYFWSLVDNFEWTEGYNPFFKFGLFGVDFDTQERHLRPSGKLYGEISKYGGLTHEMLNK